MQLVKTTPVKLSALPTIPETIKDVIYDMLNALAAYHAPDERKLLIKLVPTDNDCVTLPVLSVSLCYS